MEKLLRASLSLALLGILLLLILSTTLEPSLETPSNIKNYQEYQRVRVQGELLSLKELSPNFFVLNLKNKNDTISVILNTKEKIENKINISQKNNLEVIGKINFYNNQTQISADEIKLLKEIKLENN